MSGRFLMFSAAKASEASKLEPEMRSEGLSYPQHSPQQKRLEARGKSSECQPVSVCGKNIPIQQAVTSSLSP